MALGRVEALYEVDGIPRAIHDRAGYPRNHELWHGNPAWTRQAKHLIVDGPGARPYIKDFISPKSDQQKIVFNHQYRARAGRVYLTDQERATCTISGAFAIVSPLTKPNASPNKQWGIERWEEAIKDFPLPVYQLGPAGTHIIRGAMHFETPTMRHAAAVVERSAVVMANEGGMHHLAASMRRPAVVVFGGFMPVHITGYSSHINLGVAGAENYCGSWTPCDHCKKAMAAIAPDVVKQKAISLL